MIAPMLASLGEAPLVNASLVYEPKYDGIRAIVEIGAGGASVRLWSRLGNDKTSQFPEVAAALAAWARKRRDPLVLDGELVALDGNGEPVGFQHLQGRIHVKERPSSGRGRAVVSATPPGTVAFIAFDLLEDGDRSLIDEPLSERRTALEAVLRGARSPLLRISEQVRGDGRALYERALASGWEGIIAKDAASKYKPGKRTPDWCKLKILNEQEFVVAGWTEPRQTRTYFGALLLGVYDGDRLVYVGHTGTGFDEKELARVMARLKPLEIPQSPFAVTPKSNERPHWVRPELVAQVKFTEWTGDNKLRHPVYLGLRDDKRPRDVVRETGRRLHGSTTRRLPAGEASPRPPDTASKRVRQAKTTSARTRVNRARSQDAHALDTSGLIQQLHELEDARRDATIHVPGGGQLAVTNLHKVFWPKLKVTKGDLFRYYAAVAPQILPVLADRPLVMKRYPNGIEAKPFYQHRVQDVPAGVRVEEMDAVERRPQLVGGDLTTLMYTCQLASISQDPWFSRVQSASTVDHVALDLDPADDLPFERVLDVARWIRDELDALDIVGLPKTSGASGLHVYVPLAQGTSYEQGLLFAQLVATLVAEKHPKAATVQRAVKARGARVYVDYLQNIEGKTLASAYSARASEYAGVSTPLSWDEVDRGVAREDFTIRTVPDRIREVGDIWKGIRTARGADLRSITDA